MLTNKKKFLIKVEKMNKISSYSLTKEEQNILNKAYEIMVEIYKKINLENQIQLEDDVYTKLDLLDAFELVRKLSDNPIYILPEITTQEPMQEGTTVEESITEQEYYLFITEGNDVDYHIFRFQGKDAHDALIEFCKYNGIKGAHLEAIKLVSFPDAIKLSNEWLNYEILDIHTIGEHPYNNLFTEAEIQ